MRKVRITKLYEFEMGHALWNYDGRCRNIHGHSYKLEVTILGEPLHVDEHPKNGMVIDFGLLKRIVVDNILDNLDHAFVVSKHAPIDHIINLEQMTNRLFVVDFQPTSENLVTYIAQRIREQLPEHIELIRVKLNETQNSYVEWFASDNIEV